MTIKEIINDERIDLAMQLGMLSETELNIIDFAFERIEDAVMKRIAELEFDKANLVDRIVGLENALSLAIHWLEDEVPTYIINNLKTDRGEQ